jgi:hypothetical protein
VERSLLEAVREERVPFGVAGLDAGDEAEERGDLGLALLARGLLEIGAQGAELVPLPLGRVAEVFEPRAQRMDALGVRHFGGGRDLLELLRRVRALVVRGLLKHLRDPDVALLHRDARALRVLVPRHGLAGDGLQEIGVGPLPGVLREGFGKPGS